MPSVAANGIEIAYERHGRPGGPALLLIPGLGQQLTSYRPSLCEALAAEGLDVIRMDNRDTGLSTRMTAAGPADLKAARAALKAGQPLDPPYGLVDLAADAAGLLAALGLARTHVLGVSMGGMIAQTLAARFPDRVASLVSVMSTSGNPDLPGGSPEAWRALNASPDRPDDPDSVADLAVMVQRTIGSPAYPTPEAEIRARAHEAFARAWYPEGKGRQMLAIMSAGSRVDLLPTISVPALVIHGAEDPVVPLSGGEDTARLLPRATLHVIQGMGHDLPAALEPELVRIIAAHVKAAA